MDKGAHFYRCDFQVHTPRDLQWDGSRPSTELERATFASEFIKACRTKELNAVALTDHHDLAFVECIRKAAAEERGADGTVIPEAQRIVVFPGMELTLGVPCQAIVIFDADFPEDLFELALNALAIEQNPSHEEKQQAVERKTDITTLTKVYELFDRHKYLRGKYIVLPNVSEGGASTLIRKGYSGHYRDMPCVGGYLDGGIGQLGEGNRRILAGNDNQYGSKRLGLFQTSDNRQRDFKELGKYSTWVKWATPKAEALRQACLAQESRISQQPPQLPEVFISEISVSNSKFLGPITLEFNRQYNAIIGGRGTGKSTILEYLRWSLCDQPPANEDDGSPDFQERRHKLLANTLASVNGNVQVRFTLNGVPHVVRRTTDGELTLKIGAGEFTACSEENVRTLLPIQAYSQKQLSNVGVRLEELNRLIRTPVRQQLDALRGRAREIANEMRLSFSEAEKHRLLKSDIEKDDLESRSLTQQMEEIRKSLSGISEEDKRIIAEQARYEEEQAIVAANNERHRILEETIATAKQSLGLAIESETVGLAAGAVGSETSPLPNITLLEKMTATISSAYERARVAIDELSTMVSELKSDSGELGQTIALWGEKRRLFAVQYESARQRSTAHKTRLDSLSQIELRAGILRTSLANKRAGLAALAAAQEKYVSLREEWLSTYKQAGDLLQSQCDRLTQLSLNQVRATLHRGAGIERVQDRFLTIIAKLGLRTEKIKQLFSTVAQSNNPVVAWESLLNEFKILAMFDSEDPNVGGVPPTPILQQNAFSPGDIDKIARRITPELWLELSLEGLEDEPEFEYRAREAEYIPFPSASAGQQATALLSVLLNENGPPLVIDQPEDDLDNQVVLEIVSQIWSAKRRRQLIFSSHNANLVVNGDAELVVCFDYRVSGDQSGGTIKKLGAIDIDEIRSEITVVMEGGKEAFTLRKEKYGF